LALRIIVTRQATKDLLKLPLADNERAVRRIDAYAEAPSARHHDVVPLLGTRGMFRLRAGDWRVIFELHEDTMTIVRVHHRREAYR
jgi:mRNA interferase RelE/StbE